MGNKIDIIQVKNLQTYFYEQLSSLNKEINCPVPQEIIYYSSEVLDHYALSQKYYETNEVGKIREKILGTKLLEATQLSRFEQKKLFKDVGDTALFLCGYFSESMNSKLIDVNYYMQIGKTAYQNLNGHSPKFLDVPSFYSLLSTCFEVTTNLISKVASKDRFGQENHIIGDKILRDDMSHEEMIKLGIFPQNYKKAN